MPQPPTISDVPVGQIVKHGSQLVSFNLAGQLIAEDIQWQKGFASVDFADYSNDNLGGHPGCIKSSAYSQTKGVGTMTVQVKTVDTVIFPGEFVFFAHTGGFASLKFLVTGVGVAYTQNGATKIQVTFAEYLQESPLPQITAFDGDFLQALPCGPMLFSRPIPQQSQALVMRQKFRQFRPSWSALAMNTPRIGMFLVEETELQDTGVADIVTWDRVYATLPGFWEEKGEITKVRKSLFKQYTNNQLTAVGIGSHSDMVRCDIKHWYYMTGADIPALPGVPDVAINSVGVFTWVDAINGFPFNNTPGSAPDTNNFYSFISGSTQPYLGMMKELILIYGN